MPRTVRLRWVVAALVFVIVAPLGVLATLGIQRAWRRQLANVDGQNMAMVRAISVAVDQQIANTTAAIDVLGELHALDKPDLDAFESLSVRVLRYQPNWAALLLANPDGRLLKAVPEADQVEARVGAEHWARATAKARRTTVSNQFEVPGSPGRFLLVAVPVVRNGIVTSVIGARLRTDALSAILRRQQVPLSGNVALLDAANKVIARTRDEERYAGASGSATLVDASANAEEGAFRGAGRDGTFNYAAFSRSPRTGLLVALGLPTEAIDGPIRRIIWLLAGAWLVAAGMAILLATLLGRVIVRALTEASQASMAVARGERVVLAPSRIQEITELGAGLQQAAETVRDRNQERDEASRLKDEFLMTISHELRTPLTAICGWARMLSSGELRETQRGRAIDAIDRNASALQQLVNDLLDVSRIVSGKLRLDLQPVVLGEVVAAAVDVIRPAADAKGILIHTTIDVHGPVLTGDPGRLQQVFWNLLSNAVKFTPKGGRVDIACRRSGSSVEIEVRDTGSGVDPMFLPHVFERFRQGVSGTTRAHGGLGLGLAIVRHLVELHGGTVRAENNTGAPGATFIVMLPSQAEEPEQVASARLLPRLDEQSVHPSMRLDDVSVLIVDDDPHARELLAVMLENAGAEVRSAASMDDALAVLAVWRPLVLLSDVEMVGGDGYALMRKVRTDVARPRLIGIAVTAHARHEDRLRALDAGFDWHLPKPIEQAELLSVIATFVAQSVGVR